MTNVTMNYFSEADKENQETLPPGILENPSGRCTPGLEELLAWTDPRTEASVDKLLLGLKRDYLIFINNFKSEAFR